MDVRAILLVTAAAGEPTPAEAPGVPLPLLDVLGKSALLRMLERLRKFGVAGISGVHDSLNAAAQPFTRPLAGKDFSWMAAAGAHLWRAAEKTFSELAEGGADLVLVLRLGAYAELDFEELIQFHLDQHGRVTTVYTPDGAPLDIAVVASSRRNDAAFLFRHRLRHFRSAPARYVFRGYVNRLRGLADLRRLACDGLLGVAQAAPAGAEVRPGVWVAPGARIQQGARILAPAFIGARAKIRSAAVVTRGSVIEHHAVVDCGTVVENSTVLPYSYVGAGLDVNHAVVGFRRLRHLRRGLETEIADPRLIGMVSPHAPLRALGQAVSLLTFLPAQLLRGVFAPRQREAPVQLPAAVDAAPARAAFAREAVEPAAPALNPPAKLQPSETAQAAQFPPDFLVARRYGDQ
jgi:NDP-sugar pyrophosphorylase family protein